MTAVIVLCVVILVFVLINSLLVVTLHRLNRDIDVTDAGETEPQAGDKVKPINDTQQPENDLKKAE